MLDPSFSGALCDGINRRAISPFGLLACLLMIKTGVVSEILLILTVVVMELLMLAATFSGKQTRQRMAFRVLCVIVEAPYSPGVEQEGSKAPE
jgi:hypothetical protein